MSTVTTTYRVSGMSCSHCEGAVSEEVSAIDGVTTADADATSGRLTVVSATPPDDRAVQAAVDEAGYELLGRA